jgi:leader peptidase (prepilin peptidase)/N-methyltransferase
MFSIPEIPVWLGQWVFALFGLIFGSFFNVLIYRVPRDLPIAFPASHCPHCMSPIRLRHNIPVLGWLMLRGRCKDCRALISIQYPIVEAITGILAFCAVRLVHPDASELIDFARVLPVFWMMITLVPIAAVDFPYQLIPDTVPVGGLLIGVAVSFLPGGMDWQQSLIGIAAAGGGLFLFAFIMGKLLKRDAMGLGDVKLLAAFGAMMGWGHSVAAVIAASFLALVVMVPWRLIRKESNHEPLAFGPFIGVMGPVMFLWGDRIIAWYWNLLRF